MIAVFDGVSLTDAVVIIGVVGVLLDRLADGRGWSRSSKRLREENTDLSRYNGELEQTIKRQDEKIAERDATIARHEAEIVRLSTVVAELEKQSQAAVLSALEHHERNANAARETQATLLTEIRDAVRSR